MGIKEKQMRRAHGYNYSALPSEAADGIEQENDEMASHLGERISTLKSLTIDIGNEVREHNRMAREMEDAFDKTYGFLGNTLNKVIRLSKGRHNYYICYLCLFAVFVFFVLYVVIKLG